MSLGDSVDMLPGLSHQALLGSTALTEPIQVHGISHPLFGVDPVVVLVSLFSVFMRQVHCGLSVNEFDGFPGVGFETRLRMRCDTGCLVVGLVLGSWVRLGLFV